jgi:hypothetical protein
LLLLAERCGSFEDSATSNSYTARKRDIRSASTLTHIHLSAVGGLETGGLIGIPGAIIGGIVGGVAGAGASVFTTLANNFAKQAMFDANFNKTLQENIKAHCGIDVTISH